MHQAADGESSVRRFFADERRVLKRYGGGPTDLFTRSFTRKTIRARFDLDLVSNEQLFWIETTKKDQHLFPRHHCINCVVSFTHVDPNAQKTYFIFRGKIGTF